MSVKMPQNITNQNAPEKKCPKLYQKYYPKCTKKMVYFWYSVFRYQNQFWYLFGTFWLILLVWLWGKKVFTYQINILGVFGVIPKFLVHFGLVYFWTFWQRSVLETVEFPFIMKFVRTFKDTDHLYFLTEYIEGYELFEVLQDTGMAVLYLLLTSS